MFRLDTGITRHFKQRHTTLTAQLQAHSLVYFVFTSSQFDLCSATSKAIESIRALDVIKGTHLEHTSLFSYKRLGPSRS